MEVGYVFSFNGSTTLITLLVHLCLLRSKGIHGRASDSSVMTFFNYGLRNFTGVGIIWKIFNSWSCVAKKKCQAGGKFKVSWKLSVGITASSKGAECHCKLCMRDFSIAQPGI